MTLYKNVAVAIDFSEQSDKALQKAIQLAKVYEAALHLVAVVDTQSFGSVEAYDLKYAEQVKEDFLKKLIQKKDELLAAENIELHLHVEAGSPKKILTCLPFADVIICGATGKNRAEQLLIGSVAQQITRNAPYDVLIVR